VDRAIQESSRHQRMKAAIAALQNAGKSRAYRLPKTS
jgi:hypothetical protein